MREIKLSSIERTIKEVSKHLHTSTYQKDGQNVKRWEVRVDDVELMQYKREQQAAVSPAPDVYDDDIPF